MKLVQNYRSHEAILDFPNKEFYDNELVPCASDQKRNACIGASVLFNKRYPVLFHAIVGTNERESTSPSYFNILEAEQIKRYIDELRADKGLHIRTSLAPGLCGRVKLTRFIQATRTLESSRHTMRRS